jgi:hypothetical protein
MIRCKLRDGTCQLEQSAQQSPFGTGAMHLGSALAKVTVNGWSL